MTSGQEMERGISHKPVACMGLSSHNQSNHPTHWTASVTEGTPQVPPNLSSVERDARIHVMSKLDYSNSIQRIVRPTTYNNTHAIYTFCFTHGHDRTRQWNGILNRHNINIQGSDVLSHKPSPLLSARSTVIFAAEEHHCPLADTNLYCLVTEAHGCEQLA